MHLFYYRFHIRLYKEDQTASEQIGDRETFRIYDP